MNIRSFLALFAPAPRLEDPAIKTDCEYFEVNNWSISRFVVGKLVPLVGIHPFPLNEQMLMVSAVCRIRPSHILEWGTNIGVSARIFHETCQTFSIPAEIHSIDLPDDETHQEHPGRKRGKLVRGMPDVRLHQGDGLDVSLGIIKTSDVGIRRPLFFLDGDHSYESVRRELLAIIEQVPSANILLHDTFFQSHESGYNTGPFRAMNDVLRETGARFAIFTQNIGLPGMTFLWKQTSRLPPPSPGAPIADNRSEGEESCDKVP